MPQARSQEGEGAPCAGGKTSPCPTPGRPGCGGGALNWGSFPTNAALWGFLCSVPPPSTVKNCNNAICLQIKQKRAFMGWPGNLTPAPVGKCVLSFRQYAGERAGTPCVGTASPPDARVAPAPAGRGPWVPSGAGPREGAGPQRVWVGDPRHQSLSWSSVIPKAKPLGVDVLITRAHFPSGSCVTPGAPRGQGADVEWRRRSPPRPSAPCLGVGQLTTLTDP